MIKFYGKKNSWTDEQIRAEVAEAGGKFAKFAKKQGLITTYCQQLLIDYLIGHTFSDSIKVICNILNKTEEEEKELMNLGDLDSVLDKLSSEQLVKLSNDMTYDNTQPLTVFGGKIVTKNINENLSLEAPSISLNSITTESVVIEESSFQYIRNKT